MANLNYFPLIWILATESSLKKNRKLTENSTKVLGTKIKIHFVSSNKTINKLNLNFVKKILKLRLAKI